VDTEAAEEPGGEVDMAQNTAHIGAGKDSTAEGHESSGIWLLSYVAGSSWARVRDAATGRDFYWHSVSKESSWTLPEGVFDEASTDLATGPAEALEHVLEAPSASIQDNPVKQQDTSTGKSSSKLPLPLGWREVLDAETGDVYFWHEADGAVQWERPAEARGSLAEAEAAADEEFELHDRPNGEAAPASVDEPLAVVDAAFTPFGSGSAEAVPINSIGETEAAPLVAAARNEGCNVEGKGEVEISEDAEESGWKEIVDETSGDSYYWNVHTNETTWTKPAVLDEQGEKSNATNEDGSAFPAEFAAPEQLSNVGEEDKPGIVRGVEASASKDKDCSEDPKSKDTLDGSGHNALAEHAHASAEIASAMSAAAKGSTLTTLLATAPRLLLLHAQMELRQQDLAVLRAVLCNSGHAKCSQTRLAAAAACKHISRNISDILAELPKAMLAAETMLESLPEEGEVFEEEEPSSRCRKVQDQDKGAEMHAFLDHALISQSGDKPDPRFPSLDADSQVCLVSMATAFAHMLPSSEGNL
jgi:hypothetical protein